MSFFTLKLSLARYFFLYNYYILFTTFIMKKLSPNLLQILLPLNLMFKAI